MNRKKWNNCKFEWCCLGILIALELIMSSTFLGYIHVPPISVATAYIPVVVIGCLFGTAQSAFAGLIFGFGSMYKASALYVMADDRLFSPFQSGAPLESLILSVGTRLLFGVLTGLLFAWSRKRKHAQFFKCLTAFIAPKLHAFLVYTAMGIFFPSSGFSWKSIGYMRFDDMLIQLLCLVSVLLVDRIYQSEAVTRYRKAVNQQEQDWRWSFRSVVVFCGMILFVLCMTAVSTIYFSDRINYMLTVHHVVVTGEIQHDILHLQIQFRTAMLALNFIILMAALLMYRYMKYKEYAGQMDSLTGVMGRRLFLNQCRRIQADSEPGTRGWFLFLDVDRFKQVNDTFGHPTGDKVLRRFAQVLEDAVADCGIVGRVGGDEFAVMISRELERAELEKMLSRFLRDITEISPDISVGSSIGAYHFLFPHDITELLTETDAALYEAKESGRGCFVIHEDTEAVT